MDTIIFSYFFSLSQYSFISDLAYFLSYPFTYIILFSLVVWAIFFSKKKMMNFSVLFLSVLTTFFLARTLKIIFHTVRPFMEINIIPVFYEKGYSFPSEHTAIFSAIAVVMFLINKKAGISFSIIAILIGLSRIILGVHYPIDILGGFILGSFVGFLFFKLFKKL